MLKNKVMKSKYEISYQWFYIDWHYSNARRMRNSKQSMSIPTKTKEI